jgi:hypothetical protein
MTTLTTVSPLRQRTVEDMIARRLVPGTQVGHVRVCKRFAAWLKRSPEAATADDLRSFQLHLTETGVSATTRDRTMTGLRFSVPRHPAPPAPVRGQLCIAGVRETCTRADITHGRPRRSCDSTIGDRSDSQAGAL